MTSSTLSLDRPLTPELPPQLRDAFIGLGGLALLGPAWLGPTQDLAHLPMLAAMLPVVWLGTACMTAPALLVLGHLHRLEASPADRVAAVMAAVSRSGRLAWGLLPAATFISLTMPSGVYLLFLLPPFLALDGIRAGAAHLLRHTAPADTPSHHNPGLAVAWIWSLLTTAVGARLLLAALSTL